jgi:hypothetical protein
MAVTEKLPARRSYIIDNAKEQAGLKSRPDRMTSLYGGRDSAIVSCTTLSAD